MNSMMHAMPAIRPSGAPERILHPHLRFTIRNVKPKVVNKKKPKEKVSWIIGVAIGLTGMISVSHKVGSRGKESAVIECIEAVVAAYPGFRRIDVSLPQGLTSILPDDLSTDARSACVILEGDERSSLGYTAVSDILDILVGDVESEIDQDLRLSVWHKDKTQDPAMLFRHINDEICVANEVKASEPDVPGLEGPETAVIGLSGAGKSSLISSLLGLSGYDLPPSGTARTTLCPISFCITPNSDEFRLRVTLRSDAENVRAISSCLEGGLIKAIENNLDIESSFSDRSPETLEISTSSDALMDLRLLIGRLTDENPKWISLRETLRAALRLTRKYRFGAEELAEYDFARPIAEHLYAGVLEDLQALPFGSVTDYDNRRVFQYRTMDREAAIESGRRFFGTNVRYAGQSFGPLCSRIEMLGKWVSSPSPFRLTDSRGFDHEGGVALASSDLFDQVAMADRVLIVQKADKPGDAQTMRLVSRLIANGHGGKINFTCTQTDICLKNGVDIHDHVRSGIRNGLNTLDSEVGRDATQVLRDNLEATPVFLFGSLHEMYVCGDAGLLGARPDDELGIDNAQVASRLFREISLVPGDRREFSVSDFTPVYQKKNCIWRFRMGSKASAKAFIALMARMAGTVARSIGTRSSTGSSEQ